MSKCVLFRSVPFVPPNESRGNGMGMRKRRRRRRETGGEEKGRDLAKERHESLTAGSFKLQTAAEEARNRRVFADFTSSIESVQK